MAPPLAVTFTCADPALRPTRAHATDAGVDLRAAVDVEIAAGQRTLVPTGVRVAVPEGWVGLCCPRSGLATRHGLTLTNAPGVIDSDYRGEVQVLCQATSEPVVLRRGERIAQLVVVPVHLGAWQEVDDLPATDRGAGGFGSTGAT